MPTIDRRSALFSLNCFVAAMLALFIAFSLGLPRPYWAMMTVYITSNPLSGAVRSKAVYRLVGTLAGAAAAVAMVPTLVDRPLILSLALAGWVAGCLTVSLLDRTPRSYALMLAGYTAALIGFPSVEHPEAVFDVASARVVEIGLGIICAAVVHSLVFPRPVGSAIEQGVSAWLAAADRWFLDGLRGESAAEAARDRRALAVAASDVRLLASHLAFDTSPLRDAPAVVQAIHERMLLLIPLLSGLTDRRKILAESGPMPAEVGHALDAAAALAQGGFDHARSLALAAELRRGALAASGDDWRALVGASLRVRLAEAVEALGAGHALSAHLRDPRTALPRELADAVAGAQGRPLHRDVGLALRSGVASLATTMLACAIWIETGWADGAAAASLAAVFSAMFATQDDPAPAILDFGVASMLTMVVGAAFNFAIFPAIDGFPLLAASLLVPMFLFGLMLGDPRTAGRGMSLSVTFGSALSIQAAPSADFAAFLNGNLAVLVAVGVALFAIGALRSMSAETSARRLLRLTWSAIAGLAQRGGAPDAAGFAARLIDRLALLAPRLAQGEAGDRLGDQALSDLRVAMNMMAIQQSRVGLGAGERAEVDAALDAVGAHYGRLARGGERPAAPTPLLGRLDEALSGLTRTHGEAARRAALGLVGLRRNLFPAAQPPALKEATA